MPANRADPYPVSSDSAVSEEDDDIYQKPEKNLKPRKTDANFESLPRREHHETFIRNCTDLLLNEAVFRGTSRDQKVLEWRHPQELQQLMDLQLRPEAASDEQLFRLVKDTVKYSVKTGHPYFVNQLFSAVDPYGLVGQWMTDALNPSVYTYEVAPVFTLMEEVVLREMRKIVGYEDGRGDGIFCPGGSLANGYAISCARYKFMPDIKVRFLLSKLQFIVAKSSSNNLIISCFTCISEWFLLYYSCRRK